MNFSTLKNSFFFLGLLICTTQASDLPVPVQEAREQIGQNVENAIQAIADEGKQAIKALFPERTVADKLKDGITQSASFLKTQIDNLSTLLTKSTNESVKEQANNVSNWIKTNPQKIAAICGATVATFFLVKWLFKPAQVISPLVNPETAKLEVAVPANSQTVVTVVPALSELNTPLENAKAAIESLKPENFDLSKAGLYIQALNSYPVPLNNEALNLAIQQLIASICAMQINGATEFTKTYHNRLEKVNTYLSKIN